MPAFFIPRKSDSVNELAECLVQSCNEYEAARMDWDVCWIYNWKSDPHDVGRERAFFFVDHIGWRWRMCWHLRRL